MSHRFELLFSFSFVSRYLFPLWFLQWSIGCLVTCCLDFSCLCFLQLYAYIQFVVSEYCVWKTNTRYDFSFLKFSEGSFEASYVIYPGEISMCTWKGSVFRLYILIYITSLYPLVDWWSLALPCGGRLTGSKVGLSASGRAVFVHAVLACPEVSQHWHL